MNIAALTKTFSGHEFITAALESAYPYIDKFVFVNSDTDWSHNRKGNTVSPVIMDWKKRNDRGNKIFNINGSFKNQMDQYDTGYKYILEHFPEIEWVFIFDTDEVWDNAMLENAMGLLESDGIQSYNTVCCQMHTYIKSPFFRIYPPEECKPCVFVRPMFIDFPGVRGNEGGPKYFAQNLFFHHFTYVREKEEDVFNKIETSFIGDRDTDIECLPVDLIRWRKDVWDKLPDVVDFHTTIGAERSWHKCMEIGLDDLPESTRNLPIINQFKKED